MEKVKGFQIVVREGKDYLLIENVDKSGYVSFIEHTGKRYDITENQFLMFADRIKNEADKLREKQKKDKPKTVVTFEDFNNDNGKTNTRKSRTKRETKKSK